jgi:hypothetical protein
MALTKASDPGMDGPLKSRVVGTLDQLKPPLMLRYSLVPAAMTQVVAETTSTGPDVDDGSRRSTQVLPPFEVE